MAEAAGPAATTVLVCGAGLAGQSIARALLAGGATVLLTDRVETPAVAQLVAAGARFVGELDAVPAGVEQIVTSPGWRPDHPLFVRRPGPGRRGAGRGRVRLAAARSPCGAVAGRHRHERQDDDGADARVDPAGVGGAGAGRRQRRRPDRRCGLRRRPLRRARGRAVELPTALVLDARARGRRAAQHRARPPRLARLHVGVHAGQEPDLDRTGGDRQCRRPDRGRAARCDPRGHPGRLHAAGSGARPTGCGRRDARRPRLRHRGHHARRRGRHPPGRRAQRRERAGRRRAGPRPRRAAGRRRRRAARVRARPAPQPVPVRAGWRRLRRRQQGHQPARGPGLARRVRPGCLDCRWAAQGRAGGRPGGRDRRSPGRGRAAGRRSRRPRRGIATTRAGCAGDSGVKHRRWSHDRGGAHRGRTRASG